MQQRRSIHPSVLGAALAGLGLSIQSHAQDVLVQGNLEVSVPGSMTFGSAVDVLGNRGLVSSTERVHVIEAVGGNWSPVDELVSSGGVNPASFGVSVALGQDIAFVGVPRKNKGEVQVFERIGGTWTQTQTIQEVDQIPGGVPQDDFGWSLDYDVATGILAIGAPLMDLAGPDAGAVFLYGEQAGSWSRITTVLAPTPTQFKQYGSTLALDGNTLVVGEPGTSLDPGRAHVYEESGGVWSFATSLDPVPPVPSSFFFIPERFSASLDISGDVIVGGAPGTGVTGAAFVFERSQGVWNQTALLNSALGAQNTLGWSVAIHDDRILLPDAYNVHTLLYVREAPGDWSERQRLEPPQGTIPLRYGEAVAFDGTTLAVGAWGSKTGGVLGAGAVYIHEEFPGSFFGETTCPGDRIAANCPCGWNTIKLNGPGCQTTAGAGYLLGHGSSSLAAADLRMSGFHLPPNVPCLLISANQGAGAGIPFGDGLLCLQGPIRRLVPKVTGGSGFVTFGPGGNLFSDAIVGDEHHFQIWFRNPPSGCQVGTSFTNAFKVRATP